MKKILMVIVLFGAACYLFPVVPGYYGARALSLGYAGTALNYDVNAIFINPALLSSLPYSMTGYQYQNSYLDYKDFNDNLSEVLSYDLEHFESIDATEKRILFSKLQNLFHSKVGIYGFSSSVPGFVTRNYGISFSVVKTAFMNPVSDENSTNNGIDLFEKAPEEVSNEEIASLQMNFVGLRYKQISLSYALGVSKNLNFGVTLHYLYGKITEFNSSIVGDLFSTDWDARNYLEAAWNETDKKFSRFMADLSVVMDIGRYFKIALVTKNIGNPKIETPERKITLNRRIIAGLAFRPNMEWGVYLDMDIAKTDLLHNGSKMQPISFGVEKGFFNNRFFLRTGFLNDITEKQFFGSRSNVLYGLGLGFNMKKIVVDVALGLNGSGTVKSLAISGFILFK
jgi:hypothetical protein